MRKFYVSLAVALLATTASAQSLLQNLQTSRQSLKGGKVEAPAFTKGKKIGKLATLEMQAAKVRKALRHVASDTTSIVKDQPAGTLLKNWYAQNYGYGSFWGYIYNYSSDGDTKDIVLGDGGEVWIKNPVTNFATNSWVKGYKTTGDTIEVKLPQKIYSEGSGEEDDPVFNYSAWATKLGTVEQDGEEYYDFIPTEDGIVKYVMRNDSLIKLDDELCVSIGLSEAIPEYGYDAATWAGYAEYSFNATKINEVAATLPSSAVVQTYLMTYAPTDTTSDSRVVKVAIDGSDIYLGGLSDNMPDNFAKGKIEGGKAVFGLSYLGVDTVTLAHTYFSPATREYAYDEVYEEWSYDVSGADQIAFAYDADAKTLKASEGGILVNKGKNYVNQQEEYFKPSLSYFEEKPGKPQNPVITGFMEYDADYGYGAIQFNGSKYSVDGNYLLPSKLFYSLYIDGELFTFYTDEYGYDFKEDTEEVPYQHSYYDIYASGDTHTVYYYAQGFKTIGVQLIYKDGDDRYVSDIVTLDVEKFAGIDAAKGIAATKNVTYTDLQGRRVDKPAHGLYIKTTTKADGTVETSKVILK